MPDLTPDMLLRAYSIGVFPMAEDRDDPELVWVDPRMRGIIPMSKFHVPRRLRRTVRNDTFEVTFDRDFAGVIEGCAEATEGRPRTWINSRIVDLYTSLHFKGHGHSVECWQDGDLVGGLYGISLKGVFFGESMFSRATDASKVALVHLAAKLSVGGYAFIDTQFITKHLSRFGAIEVPRNEYRGLLAAALKFDSEFGVEYDAGDLEAILQQ
ncbi:MAG: leucyl/phenylalanyl-tRNA--protein transferase [Rhodospirillaceae bacterium]|nr:leucyl/phenylalanyl-tRNA--protein transferase [Rhodospirillaceae bacterium]